MKGYHQPIMGGGELVECWSGGDGRWVVGGVAGGARGWPVVVSHGGGWWSSTMEEEGGDDFLGVGFLGAAATQGAAADGRAVTTTAGDCGGRGSCYLMVGHGGRGLVAGLATGEGEEDEGIRSRVLLYW
ncbi:hypothetical protein Dimus_032764 [Dionaea muscipula]